MKILLTGSSSGIGRALAERLLSKGHEIWGLARSAQDDLVAAQGGRFLASRCDVSHWEEVSAVATKVDRHWGMLDALVCCAGVQGEIHRALEADPGRWSETVRVNLDGTFFPLRALHPLLARSTGRAKVVCFSGGGSTKARANFSAYGAAKTAIVRLVETIAEEEKHSRLDINAIAPGAINTRLTEEVLNLGPAVVGEAEYKAALKQKATGGNSLDRALDCLEWLISPQSDGISGRLISAPWDPWQALDTRASTLSNSDIFTLRRITPEDRGQSWPA